jgi:KDO2-lipid IV(A) lauroyltransferase
MNFRQKLESFGARFALAVFSVLSPARASALGGAITRTIGPWLPVSRIADRNLQAAMPELDSSARRAITRAVWDNLGRTIGELPHLGRLDFTDSGPGFELVGGEHLTALADGPAIFLYAHFGKWEALPTNDARAGGGL